jgi:methylenetetrahydrofolate reductase (NADPH)
MKFSNIYTKSTPVLSVELFPPHTERGWENLYNRLSHLRRHQLDFVSVTYGAAGSTRDRTLELVQAIKNTVDVTSVPHFTSIGATNRTVREFLDQAIEQGVENIVALRGDVPQDDSANDRTFQYANQLVTFIRNHTDKLDIAVAGYPEGHIECRDLTIGIQHLKQKTDAGANIVITQLFYDNGYFFRFRDMAAQAGITIPIVPGIMPIVKFSQIQRITSLCGTEVPGALSDSLLAYEDGSPEQQQAGLEYAIKQTRELLENGAPGVHIYTLNNWKTVDSLIKGIDDLVERV